MKALRLLISRTTTVMLASSMNFFDSSVIFSRSCSGVSPAACTSLMSGSAMRPSGRTCASADMSLSFQNTIDSTSSVPMR